MGYISASPCLASASVSFFWGRYSMSWCFYNRDSAGLATLPFDGNEQQCLTVLFLCPCLVYVWLCPASVSLALCLYPIRIFSCHVCFSLSLSLLQLRFFVLLCLRSFLVVASLFRAHFSGAVLYMKRCCVSTSLYLEMRRLEDASRGYNAIVVQRQLFLRGASIDSVCCSSRLQ